jgi:hypothetical protein
MPLKSPADGWPRKLSLLFKLVERLAGSVLRGELVDGDVGPMCSGRATTLDPSFVEMGVNSVFDAPESFSDFWSRKSRFVEFDDVVSVVSHDCENKPVYTLETHSGVYNAGGIVSSNCRCSRRPLLDIDTE